MRLSPDCVRDILLTVEEHSGVNRAISLPQPSFERLQRYSDEEVIYHVRQCDLSGLLYKVQPFGSNHYLIQDLTPNGHEFLENVREQSVWNKAKEKAVSVGSFSLTTLVQIAAGIIQAAISSKIGITG